MKPSSSPPFILLINPPIYDFAAYDLWAKPLGLLTIAAILMAHDIRVRLLDCCDRNHRLLPPASSNAWGCGKYSALEVQKPAQLKGIPRRYKRYGLPAEMIRRELRAMQPPDAVLVTSGMTYWYPGVQEAIALVKEYFPHVPVVLGGVYATLCTRHAKETSGTDHVIAGQDMAPLIELLRAKGIPLRDMPARYADFPPPAYSLYDKLEYAALRTTRGCPCRCSYCAIEMLSPGPWEQAPASKIINEIKALQVRGINNFAFYDDGLFVRADEHIIPLLAGIKEAGIAAAFHSPNGLHTRYISPPLARLMKETNFIMPRLSLESTDTRIQKDTGGKVTADEFLQATALLQAAGYRRGEYAAYLLMGLPGQDATSIEASMRFAHKAGARIALTEYSPIPGTGDWEKVKGCLPSDDPLWHNNSIFPVYPLSAWKNLGRLKILARKLNAALPHAD